VSLTDTYEVEASGARPTQAPVQLLCRRGDRTWSLIDGTSWRRPGELDTTTR
jgi:hypothetical protein